MAIAIASLLQESNTFSPVRTGYEDFGPVFGRASLDMHAGKGTEMGGFIAALSRARRRIEPVGAAQAITAGRFKAADFTRLVDEFAARLAALRRPEALLVALHGALAAEREDDADGYILARFRQILGPSIPIVATLDLHANLTRRMVENADAIVGYRTYPHIDFVETAERAAGLCLRMLAGKLKPRMGFAKLPLIVPAENMQTTSGPMGRLIARAVELENGGMGSVSVFGVQPWLDIHEMGCSIVVMSDDDPVAADVTACELARQFWDARREFDVRLVAPGQAIRQALRVEGGPVVLSESSDSTGSGSPGDSTGLLGPLLKAGLTQPAAVFLVDSEAVARAWETGPGGTISMRIGGKLDRRNSRPVPFHGRVRLLSDGRFTPHGKGYSSGIEVSMGRAAVLEAGPLRVLVAERSVMTVDPELYRSHGIEPCRMKIVAVKSPNGFRAEYEPISKAVIMVDTPGVSTANLKTLPFRRVPRPIWPLDRHARYPA